MREELLSWFRDTERPGGLLLAQAPTGYGKTYETVQAISRYAAEGGARKVLFATNLRKNLPETELRLAYERLGRGDCFDREVLVLENMADTVGKALLTTEVPLSFRTRAFRDLEEACRKRREYRRQGGAAGRELAEQLATEIRDKLEPAFRGELMGYLRKNFPQGPAQRRKAIRSRKDCRWMAAFYPAVFWKDYKVVLLSVRKLMARNVTLVEPGKEFLSEELLEDTILCLDEFDASRSVILDSLLERALDLRGDYLQLFLQVYRATHTHSITRELEEARKAYEADGLTWADLQQQAETIYQEGALQYCIKTVGADGDRNFLFHDTSYCSVFEGDRRYIRSHRNDEQAQVQIFFETRADYEAHREKPELAVQTLLRRIYGFLLRTQRFIYGWADRYARWENQNRRADQDRFSSAQAVRTILSEYSLSPEQQRLMMGDLGVLDRSGRRQVLTPDLSFYQSGFRLFEFTDDDSHKTQTALRYLQVQNTPEKALLHLCRAAHVVGLSATAALPTVTGNYDLEYLRSRLGPGCRDLSPETREKIRQELETCWKPYREGRVRVALTVVDRNRPDNRLEDWLTEIFPDRKTAERFGRRLSLGCTDYEVRRYCCLFAVMRAFWLDRELKSLLALNMALPGVGKKSMDLDLLTDALEELRQALAPEEQPGALVVLSGQNFDAEKAALCRDLGRGEKRFILSSYQTLGAGQNLQYPVGDSTGLVCLSPETDPEDGRMTRKDIDALFLGEVTNVAVNLNQEDGLSQKDLLKHCFLAECLYENSELSRKQLEALLRDGIQRSRGSRAAGSPTQSEVYETESIRRQITRDVLQAVGRMSRTFWKRPVVRLFLTEKLLGQLEPDCLEDCQLSPEMETLYQASRALGSRSKSPDLDRNRAERIADRGNQYIMSMLSNDWTPESMELWRGLRQTVLRHPRATAAQAAADPVADAYYLTLDPDRPAYFFGQKRDFSETYLCLDGDLAAFRADLPPEIRLCRVSQEEAGLDTLMKDAGLKAHFQAQGWATEWGRGERILSPVLFRNIYKGALGEAAGRYLTERELGVRLLELEDPRFFEYFDFVTEQGIYVDFKHWKPRTWMSETEQRQKARAKLEELGGRRALIVCLFWDGQAKASCPVDEKLIEVPGLLRPEGGLWLPGLEMMGRYLT